MRVARTACWILALVAAASCQSPVRSQHQPALLERGPLGRVAVTPLRVSSSLAEAPAEPGTSPEVAAELVARHLAEALEARGIDAVAAEDMRGVQPGPGTPSPAAWARVAAERFGADAVLVGVLYRYRARSGQGAGTLRPASVGFDVVLYGAPDGRELWRASFDETQQALSENVLKTGRYPGGGTRWLTAEELARWGAGEVVRALPSEG